jgi:hypothetical protein
VVEWINQPIPGHPGALAHVAYVAGIPVAAIDYCYDDGVPVFAVFLRTNLRQPACIAYALDDARAFVERAVYAPVARN